MARLFARTLAACASAAALIVACSAPAHAQAVKGGLVGNVLDQSGLALPGVTVAITEVNTNISYSTMTNESGYYIFSNLKDGTYRVVARADRLQAHRPRRRHRRRSTRRCAST